MGAQFWEKKTKSESGFLSFKKAGKAGSLHVGFLRAEKHENSDLTVAQIAAIHEFGAGVVPERSFMRSAMAEAEGEIWRLYERLLGDMLDGKISETKMLGLIGEFAKSKIQKKIRSNVPPPLSPEYAERKGSTRTLIDTKQMHDSVEWAVVKK